MIDIFIILNKKWILIRKNLCNIWKSKRFCKNIVFKSYFYITCRHLTMSWPFVILDFAKSKCLRPLSNARSSVIDFNVIPWYDACLCTKSFCTTRSLRIFVNGFFSYKLHQNTTKGIVFLYLCEEISIC